MQIALVLGPKDSIAAVVKTLTTRGYHDDQRYVTEVPTKDKAIISRAVPDEDKWPFLHALAETLQRNKFEIKVFVAVRRWIIGSIEEPILQETYRTIFGFLNDTKLPYEILGDVNQPAIPGLGWLTARRVRRKLLLRAYLSPGDILMLTAAVRDLHKTHPGQFVTDVDTNAMELWENNPDITKLKWHKKDKEIIPDEPDLEIIECHYHRDNIQASVNKSNGGAYHFIHGYAQDLEASLGVPVPITQFKGAIYLSEQEKAWMSQLEQLGEKRRFWIMMAGGKYDFTTKWWNPAYYQKVVDHFKDRILFAQCGETNHWHPPLTGVINLIGKTDTRQFVRLMYHADGVVCPITFAMHLSAAVEVKADKPNRACVVIAGGREPPQWEQYPSHQFIHTMGALSCCKKDACWKNRCQKVGDGDKKDIEGLCEKPVQVSPDLSIPKCMDMITPEEVIRRIEIYYANEQLSYNQANNNV